MTATDPAGDPATLLAGYAPTVRPPQLAPTDVSFVVDDTAIGRMLLACTASGGLVASAFVPVPEAEERVLTRLAAAVSPRVLRQPRALDVARRQLEDFLAGRADHLDLRVDLALASPFQRQVLERLSGTVRYGQTTTYGAVAASIGRPHASRAVGAALGANPLCVVLPCHRVVAASGALTGYAGGLAAKAYLLDLEARPA